MNSSHYSLWDRRLHWLVFILVTVALILIYAHGWSPDAWNFLGIALPYVPVADKAFSKQLENIH